MEILFIIVGSLILATIVLFVICSCKVSGDCSREEEKEYIEHEEDNRGV